MFWKNVDYLTSGDRLDTYFKRSRFEGIVMEIRLNTLNVKSITVQYLLRDTNERKGKESIYVES